MLTSRDYPTAVTARPGHGSEGVREGLRWVLAQAGRTGGQVLIYSPGKQNLQRHEVLGPLLRDPRFAIGTWRGIASGWYGGPVLATWPSRNKLAEIADDQRTKALCVVPWVVGETDAWQAAHSPVLLGNAVALERSWSLDPVVIAGLHTLTGSVNHGNNLAGAMDRSDAVAVLKTLKGAGYSLAADGVYAWALAHGWPGRGAERLRQLAEDFEAGKRPQLKGPFPFRPDILDVWRQEAGSRLMT